MSGTTTTSQAIDSWRAPSPLALTYEPRLWARRPDAGPYQAAVTRDLADFHGHHFLLDLKTLARADRATSEMARLDADAAHLLDDPVAVLAYVDAVASSRMEGITADTLPTVLTSLRPASSDSVDTKHAAAAANLIRANVDATWEALIGPPSSEKVLDIHRTLLDGRDHDYPGQWRTDQVWIGSWGSSPFSAAFVPPHAERVPGAIDDWADFCARTDLPALAHVAIAHAQFETIHPFGDGNGRTGRALVHTMLRSVGVTTGLIPISAGLALDKRRYVDGLIAFRDGDANPIVETFTDAAENAIYLVGDLVDDLSRVLSTWRRTTSARAGSTALTLLPMLASRYPAVDSVTVRHLTGASQPTADAALHRLEADGILVRVGERRRNMVWVAPAVVEILNGLNSRRSMNGWQS